MRPSSVEYEVYSEPLSIFFNDVTFSTFLSSHIQNSNSACAYEVNNTGFLRHQCSFQIGHHYPVVCRCIKGSSLDFTTKYFTENFNVIAYFIRASDAIVHQIRPGPHPFTSLPGHYSLIILPSDAI